MFKNQRTSLTRNNGTNSNSSHLFTWKKTDEIFQTRETVIHFLLSFMTGGLPEKFAANFVDDLMLRLSTSALADLPGSGSTGQLVYFCLTQICGKTCIQVLAPTGQVPVKSQVLTGIPGRFRSS
jgi:hypothetical protein